MGLSMGALAPHEMRWHTPNLVGVCHATMPGCLRPQLGYFLPAYFRGSLSKADLQPKEQK